MAPWQEWEIDYFNASNTTTSPFYSDNASSYYWGNWTDPKNEAVVQVSKKERDQENIQTLRSELLRKERRHCFAK